MANLFWGVSDALDLYAEYINAKKQRVQKPPAPLEKTDAEIDTAQNKEHENNSRGLNVSDANIKRMEASLDCDGNGGDKDENDKVVESIGDTNDPHNPNDETKLESVENCASQIEDINRKDLQIDHPATVVENDEKTNEITEENAETPNSGAVEIAKKDELKITDSKEEESSDIKLKKHDENLDKNDYNKELELELKIDSNENEMEEFQNDCQATFRINSKSLMSKMQELDQEEDTASEELKEAISDDGLNEEKKSNQSNTSLEEMSSTEMPTERQKAGEEPISFTTQKHNPIIDDMPLNPTSDQDISNQETCDETEPRVLNILIFGGGDPRHIIKTMAKRYTHRQDEGTASSVPTLKFYIIEGCMEIVARNIVLLGIALERPELINLRNKVHLFMDVYGNSLLRPICHQYLVSKGVTLLKMVSDAETLRKIAPFIYIDNLKYREIDALQDAFEFWQPKPGYDFNIKDYWTGRIRQLLAVRYDVRDGVFDWDLNMSLKDRGGQQICSQEYRYWRETGIAFTFPEYEQCKPNKTLSAGLVRNGGRYIHRGYIGDIQTGPFCTFGLRSVEERMHNSAHGTNDYRATDITERNLLEYFHEIQSGTAYVHNNALSHKYGGVRFQMGERLIHDECDMKNICAYDQPWIDVEGIEVHFLPLQEVKKIGKAVSKWENFFDVAFVGYKFFEFLKDEFPNVLRENGLLILETKLRSVEVKNRITEFETELHGFARDANLLSVLNYNALNSKNSILKYWKPEKSAQKSCKKIN